MSEVIASNVINCAVRQYFGPDEVAVLNEIAADFALGREQEQYLCIESIHLSTTEDDHMVYALVVYGG